LNIKNSHNEISTAFSPTLRAYGPRFAALLVRLRAYALAKGALIPALLQALAFWPYTNCSRQKFTLPRSLGDQFETGGGKDFLLYRHLTFGRSRRLTYADLP